MTRRLSLLIFWLCTIVLFVVPLGCVYYFVDLDAFASLARSNSQLAIDWNTVTDLQWYALWLLTSLYLAIGLAALYYLRRPFKNFAFGELFNISNSRDLRRFSLLLFAQAIAKPIHFAIASVLLSANHAVGERILSVSIGVSEVRMIVIAAVFLVVSNLLVEGCKLQSENQQFV